MNDDKCQRHEFENTDDSDFVQCKHCKACVTRDFMFGYEEGFQHGREAMKKVKEAWDV